MITWGAIILLLIATSLLFVLSGIAVRMQLILLGNFDFSVAVAALVSAELFASGLFSLGLHGYSLLAVASIASFIGGSLLMMTWNSIIFAYARQGAKAENSLFIISLGFSMVASGLVGALRGPGLRQAEILVPMSMSIAGVAVGVPTLYMLILGSASIYLFSLWVKTKAGFSLSLLAQSPEFGREVGIDASRLCLVCGLVGGGLAGVAGSYLALSSGSTPQIGLPVFLYGAGAALLFPGSSWRSCVLGGALLGSTYVIVQLFFSPAWANTLVFLLVSIIVVSRGTSRNDQRVR